MMFVVCSGKHGNRTACQAGFLYTFVRVFGVTTHCLRLIQQWRHGRVWFIASVSKAGVGFKTRRRFKSCCRRVCPHGVVVYLIALSMRRSRVRIPLGVQNRLVCADITKHALCPYSSVVEHSLDMRGVAGSNPATGTSINRAWESWLNPLTSDVRERWFESSRFDLWRTL